jgi:hypothetical protein
MGQRGSAGSTSAAQCVDVAEALGRAISGLCGGTEKLLIRERCLHSLLRCKDPLSTMVRPCMDKFKVKFKVKGRHQGRRVEATHFLQQIPVS